MGKEDYIEKRVIGEGSYGRAILSEDKKTGDLCVIKEIAMGNLSQQEIADSKKEIKILKSLNHPYIIGYKDSFTHHNILHIVMEYADNGDLYGQIQNANNVHFSEDQILSWFVQMCLAVKHIHDRKILHRDLKCQNIFLTKNGHVKLGDFGIAKVLDHTTQFSKTAIGTPYYLSPEICQGKLYNSKSDVWSLGCILYELCTLTHAFDANCMNGLVMKILRAKYSPIPYYYSNDLRKLVDMLLNKNASKRPSVNEVLNLPFIAQRVKNLLGNTIRRKEFSHTIFHGCKGGITPPLADGDDSLDELPQAPEGNPSHLGPSNQVHQQQVSSESQNSDRQQRPVQKLSIPSESSGPIAGFIACPPSTPQSSRKPPPRAPPKAPPKPAKNPSSTKPKSSHKPTKEDIIAAKNAAVVAERNAKKELKKQMEEERRILEEAENEKRAKILERRKKGREETMAKFKQYQKEAAINKKKYDKLEAPFRAMQKSRSKGHIDEVGSGETDGKEKIDNTDSSNDKQAPETDTKNDDYFEDEENDEQDVLNATGKPNIRPCDRRGEHQKLKEFIKKCREEKKKNGDQPESIIYQNIEIPIESLPEGRDNDEEDEDDAPKRSITELLNQATSSDDDCGDGSNDLEDLKIIAQDFFNNDTNNNEESNEDESVKPEIPNKIILNGREIVLISASGDDSLSYRVEALRHFIEEGIGLEKLLTIYNLLSDECDNMNSDDINKVIKETLNTDELFGYYPLINQLVVCESLLNETG